MRADENGSHRRRPPLPASMRGRDVVFVELSSDVGETAAARVFEADALDDAPRQGRPPSCRLGVPGLARLFEVLAKEPLELAYRDQPLPPRCLDGLHRRHEATVDGGDADAEGFGCLTPAVGEPIDLAPVLQLVGRCPRACRLAPALA